MNQLTQNGHCHSFANGRRHSVGRDAIVNGHMAFRYLVDPQRLAVDAVHSRTAVASIPKRSSSAYTHTHTHKKEDPPTISNMQIHLPYFPAQCFKMLNRTISIYLHLTAEDI